MNKLDELVVRIKNICDKRKWDKSALPGGCYIHLEVSEFIEALRGKGKSLPVEEAGDVLVAFFAVLGHYGFSASEVLIELEKTVADLETGRR